MVCLLVFVIPVRHPGSISDWPSTKARLSQTLASISRQSATSWRGVVVANTGVDLPPLPRGVAATRVDFPVPQMPDPRDDLPGYYDTVRLDKGRRVLEGLRQAQAKDHVMVVDYDDWISKDLAAFVASGGPAPGWYLRTGYLYDGGGIAYKSSNFHEICGTSIIVRRDLLGVPQNAAANPDLVKKHLGSHKYIKGKLDHQGEPLAPLPFPGAVYRIGAAGTTSGSSRLFMQVIPPSWKHRPVALLSLPFRLRLVTPRLRENFALGDRRPRSGAPS